MCMFAKFANGDSSVIIPAPILSPQSYIRAFKKQLFVSKQMLSETCMMPNNIFQFS